MGVVLVGCEYSGIVSGAFRSQGHEAWSCDLKKTEGDANWHMPFDIKLAIQLRPRWDLIILHIECTAMAVCGNRHYGVDTPGYAKRLEAIEWSCEVIRLALQYSDRVVVENPASVIFPVLRKRLGATVQYIQPWQHGHPEQKKTGIALWGVPQIEETNNVYQYMMTLPKRERERIFHMSPSANRGHERSRFYTGFAHAWASQWGRLI